MNDVYLLQGNVIELKVVDFIYLKHRDPSVAGYKKWRKVCERSWPRLSKKNIDHTNRMLLGLVNPLTFVKPFSPKLGVCVYPVGAVACRVEHGQALVYPLQDTPIKVEHFGKTCLL